MFEKEAEEYYNTTAPVISEISYLDFENGIKLAFKDGAEFGFKECAKSRLNVTTISDCPIKDEWHYVKDKLPEIKVGNRVDVEVCFLNVFDNPCKKSCYWNGKEFLYWSDKYPIGEKKVSLFGKIYAWKYADNFFPEPPKEIE